MKKGLVFFILIVLVVLAIIFVPGKDKAVESFVEEANAVIMADQQPGDSAVAHYVKLENSGYVVVYGQDENGVRTVLGTSALLPAGEHYNVVVTLSQPTQSGTTIQAEVVADNGDEMFDESDEVVAGVDADAMISEDATGDIDLAAEAEAEGYSVVESEDESMEESEEVISEEMPAEESSESTEEMMTEDESTEEMTSEETSETVDGEATEETEIEDTASVEVEVEATVQ